MAKYKNKKTIIISFIVVLVFWIIGGFAPYYLFSSPNERSAFGDMFGAISSFTSLLAFGGLFYTIVQQNESINMQRVELELQREELKATRLEMERSATAQEESGTILSQQLKSMKLTAKLNAYNTLLNSIEKEISSLNYSTSRQHVDKLRNIKSDYENIIKSMLKELN